MFSVMMSCHVLDAITASHQHCSRLAVSWSLTAVGSTQSSVLERSYSDKVDTQVMEIVVLFTYILHCTADVVLVIPVGVCSAVIVAPDTFTLPLMPDVVSTSENTGKLKQKTEEKRKIFFKISFIINPKIN